MNTSCKMIEIFQYELDKWGKTNIKKYPWRYMDDAYMILVSEFMLHRTQVLQVVPIYEEFIRRYLDIDAFTQAKEEDISCLLQSLGLRWRIEKMIAALHEISQRHGEVPQNYDDLNFESVYLTMLAAKSTSKERWRQVLEEANRIPEKHFCTLDQKITQDQIRHMTESRIVLVIPERIRNDYYGVYEGILSVSDFLGVVRDRQRRASL